MWLDGNQKILNIAAQDELGSTFAGSDLPVQLLGLTGALAGHKGDEILELVLICDGIGGSNSSSLTVEVN